jgi:hypothetical protein
MRYCGQCGAALNPRALTEGRCLSCGALIRPADDALLQVRSPDPWVTSPGGTTVPDLPFTTHPGPATTPNHWPLEQGTPEARLPNRARGVMLIAGGCFLLCALLLLCVDAAIVVGAH